MTDPAQTAAPLRIAPPPPGWAAGPAQRTDDTGMATASLVLGIVAVVLNVFLVPTILAIVFGAIALSRGTRARTRSIVGIVLGVVGVLGSIALAIAIPVFLGAAHAAYGQRIATTIVSSEAQKGITMTDLRCPGPRTLAAGTTLVCSGSESTGPVQVVVTFKDGQGDFTYRVAPTG